MTDGSLLTVFALPVEKLAGMTPNTADMVCQQALKRFRLFPVSQ